MSASNQTKDSIEKIFSEVNVKLEALISHYRDLLLSVVDDPLHEHVYAFVDELEALRKTINNPAADLALRIECVENVVTYLDDLIFDVRRIKEEADKKTFSNEFMGFLTGIETSLGMIAPESTVIEDDILNAPQAKPEDYFKRKYAQLRKLTDAK